MTQAQHRKARLRTYTHCDYCGKPKAPSPDTRYSTRLEYERDPYCSTTCCREAHGVVRSTGPSHT